MKLGDFFNSQKEERKTEVAKMYVPTEKDLRNFNFFHLNGFTVYSRFSYSTRERNVFFSWDLGSCASHPILSIRIISMKNGSLYSATFTYFSVNPLGELHVVILFFFVCSINFKFNSLCTSSLLYYHPSVTLISSHPVI